MTPQPLVLGLTLCEKAIVEEGTKNITLASAYTRMVIDEFPSLPQRFALYTVLTGGLGEGIMDLVIQDLENDEEIYAAQMSVRFPDRVAEVRVLFRVHRCVFPRPGECLCTLLLDGEWLAQRRRTAIRRDV